MANRPSGGLDRVGPFVAGATLSDLITLAKQENLGLHLLTDEEQKRDHYRQRFDDLQATAREFFHDYDESTSVVFEKSAGSDQVPEFIQYVYCWLVQDRLGGLILFGVDSDAGTHEEIDQRESLFWEQSSEIKLALGSKYSDCDEPVINYFQFLVYPNRPRVPDHWPKNIFSSLPQLVTCDDDEDARTRIETHYWGPSVLRATDNLLGPEIATNAAHSSQSARRILSNDQWIVVCNHALERYVRTIESLHGFTKLVYMSRPVMEDVGRKLHAERGARVDADARRAIAIWEESVHKAQETKRNRILRLSRIL
jgi:hypothetical protein